MGGRVFERGGSLKTGVEVGIWEGGVDAMAKTLLSVSIFFVLLFFHGLCFMTAQFF